MKFLRPAALPPSCSPSCSHAAKPCGLGVPSTHPSKERRRFSVLTARSFTMGAASSLGLSSSSGGVHTSPVFLCRAHKTPLVSQPFGRELGTHSPGSCGGHSRAQTNATNPSQSFATFALTPRSVMGALSCRSRANTAICAAGAYDVSSSSRRGASYNAADNNAGRGRRGDYGERERSRSSSSRDERGGGRGGGRAGGRGGGRRSSADGRGRGRGRRNFDDDDNNNNARNPNAPVNLTPLAVKPKTPSVFLGAREWDSLSLLPSTVEALRNAGFAQPARVQELAHETVAGPGGAVRRARKERDDYKHTRAYAVTAPAGAGKTLAFLVPMLDAIARRDANRPPKAGAPPFALIVAPTTELCSQTYAVLKKLSGAGLKSRSVLATGGVTSTTQVKALKRGADVIVTTPGRAATLVERGALDLSELRFFVLDEVDVLLREEGDLMPEASQQELELEQARRDRRSEIGVPQSKPVAVIDANLDDDGEEYYDEDDVGFESNGNGNGNGGGDERERVLDGMADFPEIVQALSQRTIALAERRAGEPADDLRVICATATLPPGATSRLLEWYPTIRLVKAPGLHRTQGGCEEVVIDCSGGLPGDEPKDGSRPNYSYADGIKRKGEALLALLDSPDFRHQKRWLVFCNTVETARQVENLLNRRDRRGEHYRVLAFHAAIKGKLAAKHLDAFRKQPGTSAAREALPKSAAAPPRIPRGEGGTYDPFASDFLTPAQRAARSVENLPLLLVCTDRASRGMDLPYCEHVVLFDFPRDPSEYLRRAGRTARGLDGTGRVSILALGRQVPLARGVVEMGRSGSPLTSEPGSNKSSEKSGRQSKTHGSSGGGGVVRRRPK